MRNKTLGTCFLTVALAWGAAQWARASDEPDPSTVMEFSVLGMNCASCADAATRALKAVPGVVEPTVDFDSKVGRVRSDGEVSREQIEAALATLGFEARFGDEPLDSDPLPEEVRAGLDLKTVSHGERVRIKNELASGKITVFDYYADWCGPCHLLSPKLERLVLEYDNVALRKVDLVDYESEAARQATRDFGLPGLPFTRVFDERGKLLGQVHGNRIDDIAAIVRPHARPRRGDER